MTTQTVSIQDAVKEVMRLYNIKAYQEALRIATKILQKIPDHVDASYYTALCYLELGQATVAETFLQQCLCVVPDHPELLFNLGRVYNETKRFPEAIAYYEKVLAHNNAHVGALNNLGNVYNDIGRNDSALTCFQRILDQGVDSDYIHNNIARTYRRVGMVSAAIAHQRRAVQLNPDNHILYHNLGAMYVLEARNKEAIISYQAALRLAPDNIEILQEYHDLLKKVCDWEEREKVGEHIERLRERTDIIKSRISMLDFSAEEDEALQLEVAREHSHRLTHHALQGHQRFDHTNHDREVKRKLRIGYMSSDIKDHPVAQLMCGVFRNHDKEKVETFLYSFSRKDNSGYQEKIASYCDHFIDITSLANYATAQRIYNDQIDILIDLNGHTGTPRPEALALRPAPIQVNYIGYIGSMGADFIDYVIVDETVLPPEKQAFYDEKFVYMPECYQANDNQLAIADEIFTRASQGLPEEVFVFCSMNQTYKIEPVMFEVWMNILKRVPNSVLWLYCGSIYADDSLAVENLRKHAARYGVDPGRLVFAPIMVPIGKHLKRMALADLALDTRLYNGGTVTSQTLWAGVPVLTLQGTTFASRMASSILNAVEMPELVTQTKEAYEDMAVSIAITPGRSEQLKTKLAEKKATAPLFDTLRFTRTLELAYRQMWERFCEGKEPEILRIPAIR